MNMFLNLYLGEWMDEFEFGHELMDFGLNRSPSYPSFQPITSFDSPLLPPQPQKWHAFECIWIKNGGRRSYAQNDIII